MIRIQTFDESKFDRIFVFGDLHGSFELFIKMIEKINLTKSDLIVILGDSCDRGEHSANLYFKYKELEQNGYNIFHILGNHELMLYEALFLGEHFSQVQMWLRNGGGNTIDSFKEFYKKPLLMLNKEIFWLKEYIGQMPHILTSDSYIFVHAGYDTRRSLKHQDIDYVTWSRERFWLYNTTGKEIYYGHMPNEDNQIHIRENSVFSMDVGAVFFENLKILEVKSKREFEVSLK
ncbi:metallophosphoesterase [Campylobacter sputorum]|uniref:metallophosphoesterase n=1 Tax=Campylobacter sputorum TaxID=206 RepID=UPI000B792111|nr:metallophosphoesterase [Campylobacter sputorum]ASM37149.1 metallophosphatase [Campylobacter sputorum bv. faecalis CCUG 20703]